MKNGLPVLGLATISILNVWPNVALYRVDFLSEAEREELVKDSLPASTQVEVKALLEQEENDAGMAEREDEDSNTLSQYCLELALLDARCGQYPPSTMATLHTFIHAGEVFLFVFISYLVLLSAGLVWT